MPVPPARGPSVLIIPEGDDRERLVCPDCGYIQYENPRIVTGAVCTWEGKFLLCRRAIEPRRGYWTLPAGYLELGETTAAGAEREAWEEARARITIDALLGIYNVARIGQVHLFYRARLITPQVSAGPESLEVGLFDWQAIPWDELAFPTGSWALRHYDEVRNLAEFAPRTNPPGENTEWAVSPGG